MHQKQFRLTLIALSVFLLLLSINFSLLLLSSVIFCTPYIFLLFPIYHEKYYTKFLFSLSIEFWYFFSSSLFLPFPSLFMHLSLSFFTHSIPGSSGEKKSFVVNLKWKLFLLINKKTVWSSIFVFSLARFFLISRHG